MSFLDVVRAISCLQAILSCVYRAIVHIYLDIQTYIANGSMCFSIVNHQCTHALPFRNSFGDELYIHRTLHNYDKVMKKFARDKPVSQIFLSRYSCPDILSIDLGLPNQKTKQGNNAFHTHKCLLFFSMLLILPRWF